MLAHSIITHIRKFLYSLDREVSISWLPYIYYLRSMATVFLMALMGSSIADLRFTNRPPSSHSIFGDVRNTFISVFVSCNCSPGVRRIGHEPVASAGTPPVDQNAEGGTTKVTGGLPALPVPLFAPPLRSYGRPCTLVTSGGGAKIEDERNPGDGKQ